MTHVKIELIAKVEGRGTYTAPGPWVSFAAGDRISCPTCRKRFPKDVGANVVLHMRVRAYQGLDRPMPGTTTERCVKCNTVLECKEEHTA